MADQRAVFTSRRVNQERDVVNDQSLLDVCDPRAQRMDSHERMENRDIALLEMLRRVHGASLWKGYRDAHEPRGSTCPSRAGSIACQAAFNAAAWAVRSADPAARPRHEQARRISA